MMKHNSSFDKQTLGPIVEPSPRWIRVKFAGLFIANSRHALLHRQYGGGGKLPTYYFPRQDVTHALLKPAVENSSTSDIKYFDLAVNGTTLTNAAWQYTEPPPELIDLKNHYCFDWDRMDAWYEEEEQIFVHARDPYSRIDVLRSSRHVCIKLNDKTIADTHHPHLLFETGLPTRFYLPKDDVNMELLVPTDFSSQCPYKGTARYWSIDTGDQQLANCVWCYPEPIPECPKIKDLLCFFNEHVDIYIDGELEERPQTQWSISN